MNKKEEWKKNQLTTVSFSPKALLPLKQLYYQIYTDSLDNSVCIGLKLHDDNPDFGEVKMRWFFASSRKAMQIFRDVLDSCNLVKVRDILGTSRNRVRVVQANIIEITGSYPLGRWHSDFTDEEMRTNECATLLTPLFPFQRCFGGLETSDARRECPNDYDSLSQVYRYRTGEAVLFDGSGKLHRTQKYKAHKDAKRVLVSWQLADTRLEMRALLRRIAKRNGDPMFFFPHNKTTKL